MPLIAWGVSVWSWVSHPELTVFFRCMALQLYSLIGQVFHTFVIEWAMAIRVWALYQKQRGIGWLLVAMVCSTLIHMIIVMSLSLKVCYSFAIYLLRWHPCGISTHGVQLGRPLIVCWKSSLRQSLSYPRYTARFLTGCHTLGFILPNMYRTLFYSVLSLEVGLSNSYGRYAIYNNMSTPDSLFRDDYLPGFLLQKDGPRWPLTFRSYYLCRYGIFLS